MSIREQGEDAVKGGTEGGSVATWTGQSWLLSDPIYGKVKVPARHVRKGEESISWEGSPHLEGFPSSALTPGLGTCQWWEGRLRRPRGRDALRAL